MIRKISGLKLKSLNKHSPHKRKIAGTDAGQANQLTYNMAKTNLNPKLDMPNDSSNAMFGEQYEVSLDYQKPDGYWVCSHKECVYVPVAHGINEKNNHAAAVAIAKQRYPKCRINSVTYC